MTTKKTPKTPKKSKADNANEANEADTANKANTAPVDEKTLRKQVAAATRTPEQHRLALKDKVRMFYDLQSMRLVNSGRIYKRPEGSTIYLHEADLAILERRAQEMHSAERNALRDVADHLKTIPFYVNTLSDKERYKGVGPTMAGVILSEFDIAREDTPSKMWAFAGLKPLPARRCKACQSVVRPTEDDSSIYEHVRARPRRTAAGEAPETPSKCKAGEVLTEANTYTSGKAQKPQAGVKLEYNAWLRTRLVGVLGPVLLKVGSPWRKCYDDYKHRKESEGWGRNDGHRHQAAIRYMVKMLLLDIWKEWRAHEGLPVRGSYHEEKMGHVHSAAPVWAKPATVATPATPPAEKTLEDLQIEAELEVLDA